MGCCELRGEQREVFKGKIGIRRLTKGKYSASAFSGVTKRVSFGPSLTGELRHSLAKLVPELTQQREPELFDLYKLAEDLMMMSTWTKSSNKEWAMLKHQEHPVFGTVFYLQLDLKQVCPVEDILNVMNNPALRPVWDPEFDAMHKLQGHDILDSKVLVQKKENLSFELIRFVRYCQDQVVLIETNCELKKIDKIPSQVSCVFIGVCNKSTFVDAVFCEQISDLQKAIDKKRLWAAMLFQEIIKESVGI